MFRCQLCSCVVAPRTPPQHLILQRRTRQYPSRHRANVVLREGKKHQTDDPGGSGDEIAREVIACPDCARRHATT